MVSEVLSAGMSQDYLTAFAEESCAEELLAESLLDPCIDAGRVKLLHQKKP